jgi:hypothetical protein
VLSLIAAFHSFMTRLKQQMEGESSHDAEKQKNSKRKNYQRRRSSKPINWRVLLSHEIQRHLPDHKTAAVIRYRQLTGADVLDAEQTIAYHVAHPNQIPAHFRHYELSDEQISSLHQMLRQGRRAEAHTRYQDMTGVDEFAAEVGLDILAHDIVIAEAPSDRSHVADPHSDEYSSINPQSKPKG